MVEQFASVIVWLVTSLRSATPLWFSACLLVCVLALFLRQRALLRRVDRHSKSIGHMDAWADEVDAAMVDLHKRARHNQSAHLSSAHLPSAQLPVRSPPANAGRGWQK